MNQADYVTLLRAKLNSGDIPDVFMSSAYADNTTYKDYVYDLTNADFMKMLEPSALTGVTVNGRITGYPFLVQSHSFIYNKKVFAAAGITALPRTIKEYEAVAQKLQAKGIQPFATGFKEWWVLPQTAWQVLAPIKDSFGGDYANFVDKLNSGALKFKDIKEMSTVFDVLDLIKKYGGPKPMESDFNDQCSLACNGQGGNHPPGQLGGRLDPEDEPGRHNRLPARARGQRGGQGGDHVRLQPDHPSRQGWAERAGRSRLAALADHFRLWEEVDPGQDQAAFPDQGSKGIQRPARPGDGGPPRREDAELFLVLPEVPDRPRAGPRDHPPGLLRGTDQQAADPRRAGCGVHEDRERLQVVRNAFMVNSAGEAAPPRPQFGRQPHARESHGTSTQKSAHRARA